MEHEPLKKRRGTVWFMMYMAIGLGLTLLISAASISLGAAEMRLATAWEALLRFNPALLEHQIIQTLRLPRTIADLVVGCSLAVCGAIMQGTTRNPLADSGLMGVSSGAAFAIAVGLAFFPGSDYWKVMLYACLGAALATGMTYFIASFGKRGMTPQRLVLAGLSISMLFGALSQYVAINYNLGKALAFWTAGSTAGVQLEELLVVSPLFAGGLLLALALSPSVTVLSLGDDVAGGLGIRSGLVKGLATLVVLVLTGLAVAIVGPVGFVGLITPHMVRYMVGVDYRYIIPASAVYGALLTLSADLLGRLINRPFETPIGIVLSIIGVPCFLFLAGRQRREGE